jgi:hypothetical protein
MIPRAARYQRDSVIDSSLAGAGLSMRNGTVLQVNAYAVCARSDLKNPYQKLRPSAANIYHCAGEVRGNEVDQFGSALFG